MRFVKTFVLQLYLDTDAPERLCGGVRALEAGEIQLFKNEAEFEAVLRRLVEELLAGPPPPPNAP